MDREYIHTPGYVDELVCETDRNDVPLFHLQDANFNVVGLVNAAGGMLRQYTLDPYGRVIRSEQFLAHAPSRLAHQGLFFDRLDAGITTSGLGRTVQRARRAELGGRSGCCGVSRAGLLAGLGPGMSPAVE